MSPPGPVASAPDRCEVSRSSRRRIQRKLARWRDKDCQPLQPSPSPTETSARPLPKRILCYGDGLARRDCAFHPYALRLAQRFHIPVDQVSRGPGLAAILSRAATEQRAYDTVILSGRSNAGHAPADKVADDVRQLHAVCQAHGVTTTTLLTLPESGYDHWYRKQYGDEDPVRAAVNAALRAVCAEESSVVLVDLALPQHASRLELDTSNCDGCRFTHASYNALGDIVAECLCAASEVQTADGPKPLAPVPCEVLHLDAEFKVSMATPTEMLWKLAKDPTGTRLLQTALKEAKADADRIVFAECLRGHVWEALQCPNANYFVQECIASLRPPALQFVIEEIFVAGPRAVQRASRQNFGCRVLQRLLEHCPPTQLEQMVDELLTEAVRLSVHQFGNYVMQRLAAHGSEEQQRRLIRCIIKEPETVGSSLNGCAVLSQLMSLDSSDELLELSDSLIRVNGLVAKMGRMRHGHQVVEQIADKVADQQATWMLLQDQLYEGLPSLAASRYGRSLATKFKLLAASGGVQWCKSSERQRSVS